METVPSPIFIHGIMQRSGTNFLWQLLLQHPECHPGSVGEDFLLKDAQLLNQYSKSLFKNWTHEWRERYDDSPDTILSTLGSSLIALIERPYYLYPGASIHPKILGNGGSNGCGMTGGSRLATKTLNVDNLDLFFKLFPHAHLIVIVRDGRSVVESGMKSFGWRFEEATRKWKRAAEQIIRFSKTLQSDNKRYLLVKFEELFKSPEKEVNRILLF